VNHRKGLATATLAVKKDFVPNAAGTSVEVTVTCTNGGRPDKLQKRVTEASPARFTITRFTRGATCTAAESPTPSGYAENNGQCRSVAIAPGRSIACTIFNTRSTVASAVITVTKDFSDDNPAKVSVSLTCDSGSIAKTPLGAAEGSPAKFTITAFGKGTTCTATEGAAPSGYSANESNCQRVAVTSGGSFSCTIVDTFNSVTLTVHKEFTDGSTSGVNVVLACTSGKIDDPSQGASPSRPAVFTISGFEAGATCTATENKVPPGYDHDESECQNVLLDSNKDCTIVNSPPG
jgi:hypothetical protein